MESSLHATRAYETPASTHDPLISQINETITYAWMETWVPNLLTGEKHWLAIRKTGHE